MAGIALIIVLFVFGIGMVGIYLYALIEAASSEFENSTEKLLWILLMIFVPFIGTVLYMIIGRKQRLESLKDLGTRRVSYTDEELV